MAIGPTVVATFSTTLAGAFFGAWFAFLLNNRTKRNAGNQLNIRNGNLALFNLYEYWGVFQQYQKEVIAPFEDRDDAWLNMPPTVHRYSCTSSLRDIDLSFLLGSPQTGVYAEVNIEEHRFHSARGMIELRDEIVVTEARPAMRNAGMDPGLLHDVAAVELAMGKDRAQALRDLTSGIIKNVHENLESLQCAYALLRGTLTEFYPKAKFITVEFSQAERKAA